MSLNGRESRVVDDYSENLKKWELAMKVKGHSPIMYEGVLDAFVLDENFHNGPGCSTCGWSVCWHCSPDLEKIPQCSS